MRNVEFGLFLWLLLAPGDALAGSGCWGLGRTVEPTLRVRLPNEAVTGVVKVDLGEVMATAYVSHREDGFRLHVVGPGATGPVQVPVQGLFARPEDVSIRWIDNDWILIDSPRGPAFLFDTSLDRALVQPEDGLHFLAESPSRLYVAFSGQRSNQLVIVNSLGRRTIQYAGPVRAAEFLRGDVGETLRVDANGLFLDFPLEDIGGFSDATPRIASTGPSPRTFEVTHVDVPGTTAWSDSNGNIYFRKSAGIGANPVVRILYRGSGTPVQTLTLNASGYLQATFPGRSEILVWDSTSALRPDRAGRRTR